MHSLFLDEDMKDQLAGTTALCLLVKNNTMYCVSRKIYIYLTIENILHFIYSILAVIWKK